MNGVVSVPSGAAVPTTTDRTAADRLGVAILPGGLQRDAFFPRADQDVLLAAIPNAQLLVYEGAGHGLHWEQPVRFARNVAAFAETIAARH